MADNERKDTTMGKGKKKQGAITHEDVERISQENRDRWLAVVDRAGFIADELNAIAYLIACSGSDFCENEKASEGVYSIIERGADTIRELQDLATRLAKQQQ